MFFRKKEHLIEYGILPEQMTTYDMVDIDNAELASLGFKQYTQSGYEFFIKEDLITFQRGGLFILGRMQLLTSEYRSYSKSELIKKIKELVGESQ